MLAPRLEGGKRQAASTTGETHRRWAAPL
jgi:hypothetical protein